MTSRIARPTPTLDTDLTKSPVLGWFDLICQMSTRSRALVRNYCAARNRSLAHALDFLEVTEQSSRIR